MNGLRPWLTGIRSFLESQVKILINSKPQLTNILIDIRRQLPYLIVDKVISQSCANLKMVFPYLHSQYTKCEYFFKILFVLSYPMKTILCESIVYCDYY
jgi:hypothetical protein